MPDFTPSQKIEQAKRQGNRCYWCLTRFYPGESIHGEHIFPQSKGGKLWVSSCVRCNLRKSDNDYAEFWYRRQCELAMALYNLEDIRRFFVWQDNIIQNSLIHRSKDDGRMNTGDAYSECLTGDDDGRFYYIFSAKKSIDLYLGVSSGFREIDALVTIPMSCQSQSRDIRITRFDYPDWLSFWIWAVAKIRFMVNLSKTPAEERLYSMRCYMYDADHPGPSIDFSVSGNDTSYLVRKLGAVYHQ